MKKKIVLLMFLVLILACLPVFLIASQNDSGRTPEKYYINVTISAGDTLWSIAADNKPSFSTVKKYVNEIKVINNLKSDVIYAGQSLILIVYEDIAK